MKTSIRLALDYELGLYQQQVAYLAELAIF